MGEHARSDSFVAGHAPVERTSWLEAVAATTTDAVYVKDAAGRFSYVNRAGLALIGRDEREVIGADARALFAAETAELLIADDARVLCDGRIRTDELTLRSKDGVERVLSVTRGPLRDREGNVVGLFGIARDVTDRAHADRALYDRERLLETLFRSHAAIALLVDPADGRIVDANPAAAEFYGYSIAELSRMHIHDVNVPPADAVSRSMALPKGRQHQYVEFRQRMANGELRDVGAHASPVTIGERTILYTIVHDITDRVRAQRELQDSKARLQALFHGALDAMLVIDAVSGRVVDANERAEWLFARPRERLIGERHAELYGAPGGDAAQRAFEASRSSELPTTGPLIELDVTRPGAAAVPVEVSSTQIDLGGGRRVVLAVIRDLTARRRAETERRRLEAELRQTQRLEAVGQLAGGIAHDYNNVLAAQLMNLSILNERDDLPEEVTEILAELEQGARMAADLTRQLLAFSRRQVLQPQRVDLNAVIASMAKMLRRVVPEDIEIAHVSAPEACWVDVDVGMVEQTLMNLVVNARDAMPSGGDLRVETEVLAIEPGREPSPNARPGRFVCMSVTDTGTGIDEATMLHIFEPFFTTKEKGKGTGLGLATVYGIVKQHGGWIDVHSVVGNGTSFRVYYPAALAAKDDDAEEPPRDERTRPGEAIVLLCEDEAPVRASLARALRTMGCRVLEASSADEALRTWEAHRDEVRVIVTDMVLPGAMTGVELVQRVHRARPDVSAIVCSGYDTAAACETGDDVVYLSKPFDLDALAEAVRRCVGGPARA